RAASPSPAPDLQGTTKSQSALAVSPAISEDVVPVSKPKIITVQVTNLTPFPLPISGTAKNFIPLEQVSGQAEQVKYDASKWFEITDPDFILQPKQTRPVTITITPPSG